MHWSQRRQTFREILSSDLCIYPGSVYDPLSARMAEDLGFEAAMFAGSTASLTVLGAPDIILLTLSEFAAQALRINRATRMPLVVDADHGYGNALNVRRTVEELETAGVAAMTIEDTLLPKPYGSTGAELVSIEEGVGKMRAALDGRQDPALVIAGRTSAPSITGLDDAIRRLQAYEKAGVDMLMVLGIKSLDELKAIKERVSLPLMLGGAGAKLAPREALAEYGVRICLQGHQPIAAAAKAAYDTLKALREGTPPADLDGLPAGDFMKNLMRQSAIEQDIAEFLGDES